MHDDWMFIAHNLFQKDPILKKIVDKLIEERVKK